MKKFTRLAVLLFILSDGVSAQTLHNLDFTQTSDTSKTGLAYWDLSWGAKGTVRQDESDHVKCLLIENNNLNSVGFTEQSVAYPSPKSTEIITIRASIRTENVAGKGAGLNLWLLDKNGNSLISMDTGGGSVYSTSWVKGSTGWKNYTVSLVCPMETARVKIGAILYGKGKAWYKNYKFKVTSIVNRVPSTLAIKYITAACDTIKKHSVVRDSINIIQMRRTALKIAGPAKSYSDCYLAVQYLIDCLRPYGDEHSFLMTAKERANWETQGSEVIKITDPSCKVIGNLGYILVPAFHGGNPKTIQAFADTLQNDIQKLANAGIKGWIIDLRGNTGGNQDPMIAGLGPLFTGVKLGALVDVDHHYSTWNYDHGRYYFDHDPPVIKMPHPIELKARLPIAVLTDSRTGSSGEIVAISFISNLNTRSFGQPTWGLTTGNGGFDLPDGSVLRIASTHMADRNGKIYYGRIDPDVVIAKEKNDKADPILDKALAWLQEQ